MENKSSEALIIDGEKIVNGIRPNGDGVPGGLLPEGHVTDYDAWRAACKKVEYRRHNEILQWGRDRGWQYSSSQVMAYSIFGTVPETSRPVPTSASGGDSPRPFVKREHSRKARFLQLPAEVYESEAFRQLENTDVRIFFFIFNRYFGNNNGLISASWRELEAETYASPKSVGESLERLSRAGLIVACKVYPKYEFMANEYRLTWLKDDRNGAEATNEWKSAQWFPRKRKRGKTKRED